MVRVDLIQQDHDFFAQAQGSGVAGRRRAVRQQNKAERTQQSGESQPHVGSKALLSAAETPNRFPSSEDGDWLQF